MSVIDKSIFINAPVDETIKPGFDPYIWEHWYVGLSGMEIIRGGDKGEAGSVIDFHYSMVGIRLPITVTIVEVSITPEIAVWSGTFDGAMTGTQIFTYTKKDGGTQVEAHIDYTVPGKVLGKIANLKIVEKMQEHAIEHSLANLKVLVEHSE